MSKHSPSPWKDSGDQTIGICLLSRIFDCDGVGVADVYGGENKHRIANARLIEAAPEMLAALEHVKECLRPFIENPEKGIVKGTPMDLSIICQAIAKAKGEMRP